MRIAILVSAALCVDPAPLGAAPGDLDTGFGSAGLVTTAVSEGTDIAFAAALQADGKIVAAGGTGAGLPGLAVTQLAVARYNADGSLDVAFGSGGWILNGSMVSVTGLALDASGKILACGSTGTDFALTRLVTDGSLDPSFGVSGTVVSDFDGRSDAALSLLVEPDGNILVGGWTQPVVGDTQFGVIRYRSDGTVVAVGSATRPDLTRDFALAGYQGGTARSCAPAPLPGCATPVKARKAALVMKAGLGASAGKLTWRWTKGDATLADFADPTLDDDYVLCLYDQSGPAPVLLASAAAPAAGLCAGKPCWRSRGAKGFDYRDREQTPWVCVCSS